MWKIVFSLLFIFSVACKGPVKKAPKKPKNPCNCVGQVDTDQVKNLDEIDVIRDKVELSNETGAD